MSVASRLSTRQPWEVRITYSPQPSSRYWKTVIRTSWALFSPGWPNPVPPTCLHTSSFLTCSSSRWSSSASGGPSFLNQRDQDSFPRYGLRRAKWSRTITSLIYLVYPCWWNPGCSWPSPLQSCTCVQLAIRSVGPRHFWQRWVKEALAQHVMWGCTVFWGVLQGLCLLLQI